MSLPESLYRQAEHEVAPRLQALRDANPYALSDDERREARARYRAKQAARRFDLTLYKLNDGPFPKRQEWDGETTESVTGAVLRLAYEQCLKRDATHQLRIAEPTTLPDGEVVIYERNCRYYWVRQQMPLTDWAKVLRKNLSL